LAIVTLFTDASHAYRRQIGVWAAWAKCDGRTIRRSGTCKEPMTQTDTVELAAIGNGLFCVKQEFDPPKNSLIIVQSDSMNALGFISRKAARRDQDKRIIDHILKLEADNGWRLDLRHVKAHRGTIDPRSAVNTWCDTECRRQMRIALGKPPLQPKTDRRQATLPLDDPNSNVIALQNSRSMEQIENRLKMIRNRLRSV
jgi:hypothetical protein